MIFSFFSLVACLNFIPVSEWIREIGEAFSTSNK